ncbi:MAG: transporter substrate-binding domain-containing protein [Alphaproteobacteria bacterium]|nr:transporter substrate-binding domain-containing protein [Alphaproteobacteria bacterium]
MPLKYSCFIFAAVCHLAVVSPETIAEQCQNLTISAPPEYPPFSYTNDNGLDGAGIQIARQLATAAGYSSKIFAHASWARVYQAHLRGDVDIVAALYRTPEREEGMHFLGSYAAERTILVARKSHPVRFDAWQDLIPLTGVVINGDSRGKTLDAFIAAELKVVKVHSFVNVESLLSAGRVDYALVGEFSPKVTAFNYRAADSNLYAVDKPLTEEKVYISLSRKSPCAFLHSGLEDLFVKLAATEGFDVLLHKHAILASGRAIRRN